MKVWKKEEIKVLLETRKDAVIRGLLVIYDRQTEDEKNSEITTHANGIGYSGAHAEIMTSFAKFYKQHKFLSPKQTNIARKIIVKYARQLADEANANEEKKWKISNGEISTPSALIAICDEDR